MLAIRQPKSVPAPEVMKLALMPLAQIADRFDANQLVGMAQKVGCCGPNTTHPECMVLVWDRLGRPLLTVEDCLTARAVLDREFDLKDFAIEGAQG
jgi:hypothetical protein